jgi:hypothetical protein
MTQNERKNINILLNEYCSDHIELDIDALKKYNYDYNIEYATNVLLNNLFKL